MDGTTGYEYLKNRRRHRFCQNSWNMSRSHPKRKTTAGRFAKLPRTVLATPAVTELTHAAFRVLVLLAAQFNGHNNGALGLSKEQAFNQNISNRTLYRTLRALESHGLIERTYHSSRVPPRPTMFAITWVAVDDTEWSKGSRVATRTFSTWRPPAKPKNRPRNRLHVVQ